ncbi:MAG TPA: hypothetical protein PKW20_10175 [Syntrophales bacterium]|nr:hypothetical protein [Syntrophales bacterium]
MRLYIGVDDTDHIESDRGTGKLARWFEKEVPPGGRVWGVVRQQLLVHPDVPYTSHNSAACIVVDLPNGAMVREISRRIVAHVERHADEGSDPGVAVVPEDDPGLQEMIAFGLDCTRRVVTRKDAQKTAGRAFLRGLGGTNDGIIGALAAVGLTASGWSGRFIEFGRLRDFPDSVSVEDLARAHIHVVSMDRDARVPGETEWIRTNGWLRPRLFGSRAVLPVSPGEDGVWIASGGKRSRPHSP